jgi:hypothetical protein
MTDDILPLLKPADWSLKNEMVHRPLTDMPARDMPVVAYGWDRPNTFELLGRQHANGQTPASLEGPALRNLKARKASWEQFEIKAIRLLVCGNDFLAAERILDTEFLRDAQRQLGAEMLAVGIPRRGVLMACDGASSQDELKRFCAAVAGQYHRAETPPISTTVFGVVDGAIVALADDGGVTSTAVKSSVEAEPDTIYIQTITLDTEAGRRAVICVGGEPLDLLEARIRRELAGLVSKYGSALQAEIAIIPELTPRTAAVEAWMPRLAAGLTGLAGELGVQHEVRVGYGQPRT